MIRDDHAVHLCAGKLACTVIQRFGVGGRHAVAAVEHFKALVMKEALSVMADWYKKGLIDPQMATRDTDDMISTISGGQAGAFLGAWYGPDYPLPDS